jgi:predicted N-formylglutamate amidohydrolase
MGRRCAAGVSPFARVALVRWSSRWMPSSSPVNTAVTGYRRPIGGCFGDNGRCWIPTAATIPGRWSWRRHSPVPVGRRWWASTTSRLLIDLNRSIGHPQLLSEVTRAAPAETRAQIVEHYYRPYRAQVERLVGQAVSRGHRVIHISSHSFPAELDGRVRGADVGLLYHPGRRGEAQVCARWKESLAALAPDLRVRRNYPYAGKGDGLTSHLRLRFAPSDYVGIELEVNQRIVFAAGRRWTALRRTLVHSLHTACTALAQHDSSHPRQIIRVRTLFTPSATNPARPRPPDTGD